MSEKIIVASFWTGPPLSNMEIMSIKSFLKNGYEYHLYVYENIENIPDGVVVMDANEIINKSEIFSYQNGSFSSISLNGIKIETLAFGTPYPLLTETRPTTTP
jgi:hypothetical protein